MDETQVTQEKTDEDGVSVTVGQQKEYYNSEFENKDEPRDFEAVGHGGARPKNKFFQKYKVNKDNSLIGEYSRRSMSSCEINNENKRRGSYRSREKVRDMRSQRKNKDDRGSVSSLDRDGLVNKHHPDINRNTSSTFEKQTMKSLKQKDNKRCDELDVSETGQFVPTSTKKSNERLLQANRTVLGIKRRPEVTKNATDEWIKGRHGNGSDDEIPGRENTLKLHPKIRGPELMYKQSQNELQNTRYVTVVNSMKNDNGRNLKRKRVVGYPFLKSLVGKDPGYIILKLTKEKTSLKECLERVSKENDFLELFLQVLSGACTSNTTPNLMITLFETLKEVNFFDTVLFYLIDIMTKIDGDTIKGHQVENVLQNILNIIMEHITRNPSSIYLFGRIHTVIGQIIENMMKCEPTNDSILCKFRQLTEEKKRLEAVLQTNCKSGHSQKPPDDFRDYQVSPSPEEITGTMRPFLRPNKVGGRYDDLDHYLDVQFRLLREDFVGPLREGITEYIKQSMEKKYPSKTKNTNIKKIDLKIYENVRVHTPAVTERGLCYKLQLEMNKRLQQTNWRFSKRLIYGSMVCLTDNDFNSFYLATVVGRDEQDIKNGFFTVHFEDQNVKPHDLLQKVFRMAESSAYFESYRHVLSSLQTFRQGDLPFEKYIVSCEAHVDPPAYLTKDCEYDLRPLTDDKCELQSERRLQNIGMTIRARSDFGFSKTSAEANSVPVCDQSRWPSKELLHLDESQYAAVQTALTKEFAIVQGPPGTGKTYIGLQIVKALLHNKSVWASSQKGIRPMLIVCYTNHALDQFLEGIYKFFKGDILRVGGRSDSAVLRNCNLKYYRQTHQQPRSQLGKLQQCRKQALGELEEQSLFLQELATSIEVYNSEVLSERFLSRHIGARLHNSLVKGYRGHVKKWNGFSYIVKWLGIKFIQDTCRNKAQNETEAEDKFVYVEDEMRQRQRNLLLDADEENRSHLEEKAQLLLQKIRRESRVVCFVDADSCSVKNAQPSQKELNEAKFHRLFRVTIERKISDPDIMSQEEADAVQDVWRLNHAEKWRLYRLWIQKLCNEQYDLTEETRSQFEEASERYRVAVLQEEKEIMRQASVIGMTTSGAARYQLVLRDIGPRIVIVEEAAEVLEAHIITTLSKGCEHLILIGDHKQLRPNPNVYKLATRYKLNISFFERMIKNGMNYNCLQLQHRMRPDISCIVKHIYPELQDHDDVKEYPEVKGISTNVFLINHEYPEKTDEDLKSYSNLHEAQYVAALCRYLLLQGYKRHEITILTTYTGQLICIRKFMPKEEFKDVKVTVVDNFQGEENEIIILSLVRSNRCEKIGFLKTENRICVALSRAKVGFYMLGNFHHLAAYSSLWKTIVDDAKDRCCFGNGLKLYCQNHPQKQPLIAEKPTDFAYAPEGGCSEICKIRLECGHKCRRHCHVLDRAHKEYKCTQNCTKILCNLGHTCPDKCYVPCGPCRKPQSKVIPSCKHIQTMECREDPARFFCKEPCEKTLTCGHRCKRSCGANHTEKCTEETNFTWPCGHTSVIECWKTSHTNVERECPHPCMALLKCEHFCGGTCGTCFTGRVHVPCMAVCKRILVCGHECKASCRSCLPCRESCKNRCFHSVCDRLCGELCAPCKEECSWQCEHYRCSKLCSDPCDRPRCNEPCKETLEKCGHPCIGICGEPCPSLCKICDKEIVTEILFGHEDDPDAKFVLLEDCGHIIESEKMDEYMEREDEELSIQIKTCPLCKTPIRKCLRYGSIVNKVLQDIERVKKEIIGDCSIIENLKSKIRQFTASSVNKYSLIRPSLRIVTSTRKETYFVELDKRIAFLEQNGFYCETQLKTIENQLVIARAIKTCRQKVKTDRAGRGNLREKKMLSFLKEIFRGVLKQRDVLTEQEVEDYKREIERVMTYSNYLKLVKKR